MVGPVQNLGNKEIIKQLTETKMKHIIILLSIVMLTTVRALAQPKFEEGWVATVQGDTVQGKLKVLGPSSSCAKVYFLNAQGKRIKFKLKDIASYQRGEKLYVSKPTVRPLRIGGGPNGLMQVLHKGPKVTLYEYYYTTQSGGFGPGQVTVASLQSDYYIERHGKLELVRKSGFKHNMSAYFADDKALAQKIIDRSYKYKDMEDIVQEYNDQAKPLNDNNEQN